MDASLSSSNAVFCAFEYQAYVRHPSTKAYLDSQRPSRINSLLLLPEFHQEVFRGILRNLKSSDRLSSVLLEHWYRAHIATTNNVEPI